MSCLVSKAATKLRLLTGKCKLFEVSSWIASNDGIRGVAKKKVVGGSNTVVDGAWSITRKRVGDSGWWDGA